MKKIHCDVCTVNDIAWRSMNVEIFYRNLHDISMGKIYFYKNFEAAVLCVILNNFVVSNPSRLQRNS